MSEHLLHLMTYSVLPCGGTCLGDGGNRSRWVWFVSVRRGSCGRVAVCVVASHFWKRST
jgi:hypothetical protein